MTVKFYIIKALFLGNVNRGFPDIFAAFPPAPAVFPPLFRYPLI